jgi:hypothetical protein
MTSDIPGPGAVTAEGSTRRPALAAAVLAGAFAACVIPVLLRSIGDGNRSAWDQNHFHLPVIEQFSRDLPRPDLSGYRSATAPGYHLLIAAVHRYVSADERVLRAAGALITVALLGVLGGALGRRVGWRWGAAMGLPVAASLYVFGSGAWLLPDNLGWLTVLLAVLLAYRTRVDRFTYVAAAAVLAAAVFVRQLNLWPLGVLTVAAAVGAVDADIDRPGRLRPPLARGWGRRAAGMLVAGLPAVLVLAWLVSLWGGLTPPAFREASGLVSEGVAGSMHQGFNPAVPAMVLAVLGATGLFFTGFVWERIKEIIAGRDRRGLAVVLAGAGVGAAAALLAPTSFDRAAGRYSGLWNVARAFPVVADRSLLVLALAALGGAIVAIWFLAMGPRDRWIWLAAWGCFVAAQAANRMAWQRYYEPFCLIMLALAASRVAGREDGPGRPPPPPRWAVAGPLLLAGLLATVTLWSLRAG